MVKDSNIEAHQEPIKLQLDTLSMAMEILQRTVEFLVDEVKRLQQRQEEYDASPK